MYQFAYDEIAEDSQAEARDREAAAFSEANRLLGKAMEAGVNTPASSEALAFNQELWTILLEDLAHPQNKLPEETRAALISIGIWVIKEVDRIRNGQSSAFKAIADINTIIRDGLH